jgi:hypothetical protein
LPYLGYPDITPAKKFLVLAWLGQLVIAGEKWTDRGQMGVRTT